MDGAHQHAFWKQRVYKEERDRYLLYSRTPSGLSPTQTQFGHPIYSPSSFKPNHSNPAAIIEADRHRLPPLRVTDSGPKSSPSGSPKHLSSSGSPAKSHRFPSPSSPKVSYRPRGPPASLHGVSNNYHTFTYQGQAFLEDTS